MQINFQWKEKVLSDSSVLMCTLSVQKMMQGNKLFLLDVFWSTAMYPTDHRSLWVVCFVGLPSRWHIYPTSHFIDCILNVMILLTDWTIKQHTSTSDLFVWWSLNWQSKFLFTLNQDKREKWSFGQIRFQTRGHKMSKWEERKIKLNLVFVYESK